MNTNEYLDAIKGKMRLKSDAKLADALEITGASLSRLRAGHTHMSDETALRAAKILEVPAIQIIAECHAERAKSKEAEDLWEQLAELARDPKGALRRQGLALC